MLRRSALPILALLAGCSPEPPQECAPSDAPWVDFDGDGFPASVDCNDSDPNIHPAAFELCDGVDNNCNGLIDEGFPVGPDGFPDCDPVEICDGIDNNYNGLIDEGFPDFDGDGIADCLDDHCEVLVDLTDRDEPADPDCVGAVFDIRDPWNIGIKWQWREGTDTSGSYALPVIARFVDTNGDGDVDFDDSPVIVVTTNRNNLIAVRGDTGEKVLDIPGMSNAAGAALADMTGDGYIEAITLDSSSRVVAIDRFGTILWRSTATDPNFYSSPIVADVDGDGNPEVITQTLLINGQTGELITNFGAPAGIPYYIPTVADLDLDGEMEILIGRNVYRPDGTIKWSHTIAGNYGHWAAPINMDDDPEAEVVIVGGSQVGYYEHDGTPIRVISTSAAAQPGPVCVADFDGDGVVEIAWASRSDFSVYNLDGTIVWGTTVQDFSGLAGCSGFDIDGDGAYEVLFADEVAMRIFDGRTGAVRYEQFGHRSVTLFEYPTISDVDGDGSADIVIVSNFHTPDWGTITVFHQVDDTWPPSGQAWPVHDYAVTNVLPDGTVPADPEPSWLVHNVYRARPSADTVAANVQAEIVDACVSGCVEGVGVASLSIELFNGGESAIRTDIPVSLYKQQGADLVLLDTQMFPGGLPGLTRRGGLVFTVGVEDIAEGFVVRADDTGRGTGIIAECNEDDNETTWPYPVCD